MSRPVLNKYVFDYGLVLKEDPTFEKFIEYEQEEEEERIPTEASLYEEVIGNIRARVGTTGTAEKENVEENEIIDFVHDKDDNKELDYDWDLIEGAEDTAEPRTGPCTGIERSKVPKSQPRVHLKPEYENPPNPNYDPSIPQLLPPNRFLKEGSKVWMGEDTFYSFHHYRSRDNNPHVSTVNRYHYSYKPPFIRFINSVYWFDRSKNTMAECKTSLKSLVYNMETKQIYWIKRKKSNSKKSSRCCIDIKNIFNMLTETTWNENGGPDQLKDRFLNSITQAVIKDIGEVVIPEPYNIDYTSETSRQRMKLAVVLLQHKVGQPIHWLNYLFISNLWSIMSDLHFYDNTELGQLQSPRVGRTHIDTEKKERALRESSRKKTVGKLIPNLKKSNHMRTAVKAVFGKYYSKFFVRLLNMLVIDKEFLSIWITCMHEGHIDKDLYHWFVQSINSNNAPLVNQIIGAISPVLYSLIANHENVGPRSKSYIKICKRLKKADDKIQLDMPSWHTWNDIYNMADQLNIRIRPNKLTEASIVTVHNKLSDIMNRDRDIIRKYQDVIFDEYISPDKDYDGFRFVQLRTAEELRHEGTVMHHCVGGYAYNCAEGTSIIFSMRKGDKSYITIEVSPKGGHEILQQYTLHDITVTSEKVLDIINRWRSDCVALHVKDTETYYDKCKAKLEKVLEDVRNKSFDTLLEEGMIENATAV